MFIISKFLIYIKKKKENVTIVFLVSKVLFFHKISLKDLVPDKPKLNFFIFSPKSIQFKIEVSLWDATYRNFCLLKRFKDFSIYIVLVNKLVILIIFGIQKTLFHDTSSQVWWKDSRSDSRINSRQALGHGLGLSQKKKKISNKYLYVMIIVNK